MTVALIGGTVTVIVAIIGVASVLVQRSPETAAPVPIVTVSAVTTTETPTPSPSKMFEDNFDDDKAGWDTGEYSYDNYHAAVSITNGMLVRSMETTGQSSEYLGSIRTPGVLRKDFCLTFDAGISDFSGDPVIVVLVRSKNYSKEGSSHYYIGFENDAGSVWLDPETGTAHRIGLFDKGISWNDKKMHSVKVSMQDNTLKIYDLQTNSMLYDKTFDETDLLPKEGQLRLGTELLGPNQKATVEFDNVVVYDRCP